MKLILLIDNKSDTFRIKISFFLLTPILLFFSGDNINIIKLVMWYYVCVCHFDVNYKKKLLLCHLQQ